MGPRLGPGRASGSGLRLCPRRLRRFPADPRASLLAAIERAFDEAGVILLEVGDARSGGRGVRLK